MKIKLLHKILLWAALCTCQGFVSTAIAAETSPSPTSEDSHPDTVWFFVYLLDVDDINASEQNFAANVLIKLRWKDERLTMIAYRIVMANHLPNLPYMTRMDYFSLISIMMVFFALVEVIVASMLAHTNRTEWGRRIDRFSRVLFPVALVLAAAWSFL